MSQSKFHRLNELLLHSCNRVLRALLPAVIERNRPSGARTIDDLIHNDRRKIESIGIIKQNKRRVFTWNNIVDIKRWDLQLTCFFIKYVCPANSRICDDIDALTKIRNDICHTSTGLIDDIYYQVKRNEIKVINNRFLAIIGNATFKEEIENEITEIDNGSRNIAEAVDTLREWLDKDKCQRTPIDHFSDELQEILGLLRGAVERRQVLHIPDTEIDINVENADNIQQQDQVSEVLVSILDPQLRSHPQLGNLTEAQYTAIEDKCRLSFGSLIQSGQVIAKVTHGCVIVTVRSNTFESLSDLWLKLVSTEAEVIMAPLQEILRKTFSERLTIKAVLPECAFLDVAEQLVQQIKEIDQKGSRKGPESLPQIPEVEKGMKKLNVQEKSVTYSKSAVNLKIKSRCLEDYERLHRELSEGKLETAFETITHVLQQELKAPKLIISANLKSSGLSAKQNRSDVAFTCANGTRLHLIMEDIGAVLAQKEAIVVETTKSFDFKSSEIGQALLEACGEQIVKQCHDKYPRGLLAGQIAEIEGQKLLGGTLLLLPCLPEYSGDIMHILKRTLHTCLVTAVHRRINSIAFTAVGTRNAKYPVDAVAATYIETCINFDEEEQLWPIQDIAFVVPTADELCYLAFKKELERPGIFDLKPSGSIGPSEKFHSKNVLEDTTYSKGDDCALRLDLIGGDLENMEIDQMGHGIVVACRSSLEFEAMESTQRLLLAGGPGIQTQCNKKYPKGITHGEVAELYGIKRCLQIADEAELRTLTFTPLGYDSLPVQLFVECLMSRLMGRNREQRKLQYIQILEFYKDESLCMEMEHCLRSGRYGLFPLEEIEGTKEEAHYELYYVDQQKDFLEQARGLINVAEGRIAVGMQDKKEVLYTRQFFNEFFKCVSSAKTGMFISSSKGISYIPVKNEEIKEMFFTVGKAVGLAWLSVEEVELPLAGYVVLFIHGQAYGHRLNVGAVHDTALVQFLQKINTCAEQAELDDIVAKYSEGYLSKYGVTPGRKIDSSEIATVCKELLNSYLIDHRKDALEQMRIGLSSLNEHTFADSMIGKCNMSISKVRDLFQTKIDELSVSDEVEERGKLMMKSYVRTIEEDEVWNLLKFIVGDLLYAGDFLHFCICFNKINRRETRPISVQRVQLLKLPLGNDTDATFKQSINDTVKWIV